tara:strand:+ start:263 stop:691 length:429 start_codon:yes stop_codon:yes gene_type:complete
MKKSELKMMIREVVREEIKLGLKNLVSELNQTTTVTETKEIKPKRKVTQPKSFSKNSVLNDVLNETAQADEWKTLAYDSSNINDLVKSNMGINQNDIVADTAVNAGVSPDKVPEHLEKALTRNYSDVLKATAAKAQQTRNNN